MKKEYDCFYVQPLNNFENPFFITDKNLMYDVQNGRWLYPTNHILWKIKLKK
jgi:hypothetical protein